MTTLSTYQNLIEKVGLSKLDEANRDTYNIVKEGSANFTDANLWNEMLADADICDTYELHVKALESMASSSAPPKEKKPKATPSPKKQAAKKIPTEKKTARAEQKKVRQAKAKKVKSKKAASVKKTKAAKPEMKFPVTVKRFSVELQLIKRFVNLDGKQKTTSALGSFHKSLGKTLKSNPDRKPLLSEMSKRLKETLRKAETNNVTHINVSLEKPFKEKLLKSIKGAKPKVKLEFLGELSSTKAGFKKKARTCRCKG
ncbi:MAG: hypothetical protein JSS93_04120 [Bacteroidetes bacterium]|nr:hypothetical protein [Bacteroidota bacterium]MBS1981684.1 hypothetical protein [Bacteroidota bacterium]